MNCEICQLKELEVQNFEVREVLRCILHTIVFHRALGLVRPKDIDSELFEITYGTHTGIIAIILYFLYLTVRTTFLVSEVQCGDAEVEKKIDEKIDQFMSWAEKHQNRKSQICMSFYEVKNKQAMWFGNKVERHYWEQWYVNLHVIQPKIHGKSHHSKAVSNLGEIPLEEGNPRLAALEVSLREVLFQIIKFVNEKKDHIPPIPNLEGISFPYEITIPSSSDSSFGRDMFKRMLQTGHPSVLS